MQPSADIPTEGDRLNELLSEAEEMLQEEFRTRGEAALDDRWRLIYGIRHEEWKLYLEDTVTQDSKGRNVTTELFSSNIKLRILAAKQIPNLFDHLTQTQTSRIRDASRAVEDLREFLAYRRKR